MTSSLALRGCITFNAKRYSIRRFQSTVEYTYIYRYIYVSVYTYIWLHMWYVRVCYIIYIYIWNYLKLHEILQPFGFNIFNPLKKAGELVHGPFQPARWPGRAESSQSCWIPWFLFCRKNNAGDELRQRNLDKCSSICWYMLIYDEIYIFLNCWYMFTNCYRSVDVFVAGRCWMRQILAQRRSTDHGAANQTAKRAKVMLSPGNHLYKLHTHTWAHMSTLCPYIKQSRTFWYILT